MNHHPAHSPLPSAPAPRAAIVRLRDGATIGARVAPRIYGSARWLSCHVLTEPPLRIYVAVETVAWIAWVDDARARAAAARYGDRFLVASGGAAPARPLAPIDPSTAPPPATEVLDADLLLLVDPEDGDPEDGDPAPRVWLALLRQTTRELHAAVAEWASEHGAILPEVRGECVAFQVPADDEGRFRAAASAAGLVLGVACARCGWTPDLPGSRSWEGSICSDCRAGGDLP